MQERVQYLIILVVFTGVLSFCIHRDILIEKQYTGDLRNRVVGARLQMDGIAPYFYKWHPADGLRYYDPIKFDTTYSNAISASPFFHTLLFPIANLEQRQISRIWLITEYLMFLGGVLMAFSFTVTMAQRWAVAVISMLFLFTEAWLTLISLGQIYMIVPFLGMLFLFFIRRQSSLIFPFFAGLSAIFLVLIRPTTALFFFPLLLMVKRYSFKYLLVFFIPVVLLTGFSLLNHSERTFWLDYREGIAAHIKNHQSEDFTARNEAFQPIRYNDWEGWNEAGIERAKTFYPLHLHLEYAGVQGLIQIITGKKIPYQIMALGNLVLILILTVIFYARQKRNPSLDVWVFAIFGFCLYMTLDFFSPILRIQYYTVQWIFPLLVLAAFYNRKLRIGFLLLITGVVLNTLNLPFIAMRHTLGEYLILLTLLWLCTHPRNYLT